MRGTPASPIRHGAWAAGPEGGPGFAHRPNSLPTPARGLFPAGDSAGDPTAESLGRQGTPRAAVTFKLFGVPY